jgi:hypothetical protein
MFPLLSVISRLPWTSGKSLVWCLFWTTTNVTGGRYPSSKEAQALKRKGTIVTKPSTWAYSKENQNYRQMMMQENVTFLIASISWSSTWLNWPSLTPSLYKSDHSTLFTQQNTKMNRKQESETHTYRILSSQACGLFSCGKQSVAPYKQDQVSSPDKPYEN